MREVWYPNGEQSFSVDHARPQRWAPDLVTDYENLLYACIRCNSWKSDRELLDPTRETMSRHVRVELDGHVTPLTEPGRRFERVLGLNTAENVAFRRRMLDLLRRALEEPRDTALLREWFGYPRDLPRLASLRPPSGNSRPGGVQGSYDELRRRGALPELMDVATGPTAE
jgi:hypothetical protein